MLNAAEVSNMMKTGKCPLDLMSCTRDLGKNYFGEWWKKEARLECVGRKRRQQIQRMALRIHGAGNAYQALSTARTPSRCTINVNFFAFLI